MIAYVDGSPVLNKIAVYIQGEVTVYGIHRPNVTNNQAEYIAVYAALLYHHGVTEIVSDSLLIVNQLNGQWKINAFELQRLYNKVKHQERMYFNGHVVYTWVPRGTNPAGLHLDKLLKEHKKGLPCH